MFFKFKKFLEYEKLSFRLWNTKFNPADSQSRGAEVNQSER